MDEQRLEPRAHGQGLGERRALNGVALVAGSRDLRRQLSGLSIEATPFIVGRAVLPGESQPFRRADLELHDEEPLRLSRNHFAIVQRDGQIYLRDLRSTLGTIVNGWPIGEHFGSDEAPLVAGDNEIVAGGKGSPFVFSLTLDQQRAPDVHSGAMDGIEQGVLPRRSQPRAAP